MIRAIPKRFGLALVGGLVFVAAFASSAAAVATYAYSYVGYYTVNGIQYKNQAYIAVNVEANHYASATTRIAGYTQSVPSGYMKVQGRLIRSNGSLYCSGTVVTQGGTYSAGTWLNGNSCGVYLQGTWHSKGITQAWTGSAYTAWYTLTSPDQDS